MRISFVSILKKLEEVNLPFIVGYPLIKIPNTEVFLHFDSFGHLHY